MNRRLSKPVRSLGRDEGGLAAVEFALLAPVMILLYFGMVELCQGFLATKRAGHTTSMVADLVAQTAVVTPDELDDVFAIGALIMKPYPASHLRIRVASVTRDNLGRDWVDWVRGDEIQDRPLAKGDRVLTIPDGLIQNGESLVMSETTYDYQPAVGKVMPSSTLFRHDYYLRPRISDKVVCAAC